MNRTLYALTEDVIRLNDFLDDIEGDLSRCGEMEPAVTAWLTSIEHEQARKLDNYANLILQLEMEAVAARAEAEQWHAKAKARDGRARYLKEALKNHLILTGQTKATTLTGRVIAVQNNGGMKPIVWSDSIDLDAVPEDHVIVRREIDRAKVRETLEAGGAFPFAVLGERGTQLRIR